MQKESSPEFEYRDADLLAACSGLPDDLQMSTTVPRRKTASSKLADSLTRAARGLPWPPRPHLSSAELRRRDTIRHHRREPIGDRRDRRGVP
jgi:hypothetical protein